MPGFSPLTAEIPADVLERLTDEAEYIMNNYIDKSWKPAFKANQNELIWALYKVEKTKLKFPSLKILPETQEEWFSVFKTVPLTSILLVILGQDPYPGYDSAGKSFACGAAFSTHESQDITNSLTNVFRRIKESLNVSFEPKTGSLSGWMQQGVFLLNASLTVIEGDLNVPDSGPGSMTPDKGNDCWSQFISCVVSSIVAFSKKTPFLLWGSQAKLVLHLANIKGVVKLESGHPSYYEHFKTCNHFIEANDKLKENKKKPIDWTRTVATT